MSFVYYDSIAGAINYNSGANALSNTGSTATLISSGLNAQTNNAGLPTISSPNQVRITFYSIDPSTGMVLQRENCYITAFTAGAGVSAGATILRAQDGTTQQAWPEGSLWTSGISAEDIALIKASAGGDPTPQIFLLAGM